MINEQKYLCEKLDELVNTYSVLKLNSKEEKFKLDIKDDFRNDFFKFIDKINLSLMEDNENFYGYFIFQMNRDIKFDIASPTATIFKNAKYTIYFNPVIFLNLTIPQMKSSIKHEILHIISMHIFRSKKLRQNYSDLAINMAMDIVVNSYLNDLPPFVTTLENVNLRYSLNLEPYETFEYYVENIQNTLDLMDFDEEGKQNNKEIEDEYKVENTHDIWYDSDDLDEKTLKEFTQKLVNNSQKGEIPSYLGSMISNLKNKDGEIPWNLYLKKIMGTIEGGKKKTITRRNRRQPNRLDLRGEMRSHKAEIVVAIDISGSISDEEFIQAIEEVLNIVKSHNNEITIVECDNEIKRIYKVKSKRDLKERLKVRGGTKFSPVFEYANSKKINLLIYFTDGKGEERLSVVPKGYKVLWVLSGRGEKISLLNTYGLVKKLSSIEIKDNTFDMSDVRSDGYSMTNQAPII